MPDIAEKLESKGFYSLATPAPDGIALFLLLNSKLSSWFLKTSPVVLACSDFDKFIQPEAEEKTMLKMLNFLKDEKGATAIEYGLIAALVSVAIVGALLALGPALSTTFNTVTAAL